MSSRLTGSRFDLEKALAAWRHLHRHRRAFVAEDLDELEQHVRDHVAHLLARGLPEEAAFRRAVEAVGDLDGGEAEYGKVYWGKLRRHHQRLNELAWRFAMLKSYVRIAFRNLLRRKGSSFINFFGLTVGITCCLLIGLYVRHEWRYDRFHEKADRLYRVTYEQRLGENLPPAAPHEYLAWGMAPLAPALAADFPEVEHAVRLSGRHQILLTRGDRKFQEERYFYADSTFFDAFSFPLRHGDPATALARPGSIVLTERAAQRYFGDEAPLGQTLRLGNDEVEGDLTVTGVMADLPANSHLDFDLLISMRTFEQGVRARDRGYVFDEWGYIDFFTYVVLREGASAEALQAKLPAFVQRHRGAALQDPPRSFTLALEPVPDAYLSPVGGFPPGPRGNEANLYLFSFVGLFILLIACVNFMNLATAHAASRAKEVGVRKTVGARRSGLVGQFLTEAVLLAFGATGLAVGLAHLALPFFRQLAGKEVPAAFLTGWPVLGVLAAGTLLVGLLAGGYPAFVLSAFRPSQALKGAFAPSQRGAALRKGLVVFQFATAIVLLVGTLAVRQQLHYLQARPLGFDDAQQLVLDFGGDPAVRGDLEAIKQALAAVPGVQRVAVTRSIPGGYFPHAGSRIEAPDGAMQELSPGLYEVDVDFLSQIGVAPAAGRLFSRAHATDAEAALLLNESAARALGYADPAQAVGKRFEQWGRTGEVVGVVKDFNYESLHHEIRPLAFRVSPWLNYLVLQVTTEDAARVVEDVRARWAVLAPHRPFLFSFLDQTFDAQYRAEDRFGVLFGVFAGLAIFIACLGLFGLAAFSAAQRTKEIGVRKVLGASVGQVVVLLTRAFARMVLVAAAVAFPLAYLLVQHWLAGFAYRIRVPAWIFVVAGAAALGVALLTVSYQSIKAALADPVKSLRYE